MVKLKMARDLRGTTGLGWLECYARRFFFTFVNTPKCKLGTDEGVLSLTVGFYFFKLLNVSHLIWKCHAQS